MLDAGAERQAGVDAVESVRRIDGRHLRSRRTRERLIAAYLELLSETGSLPTCNGVARRAGCSVRTLFDRFQDMAGLARAANARAAMAAAIADTIAEDAAMPGPPAALGPVALDRVARIRLHVTTRARLCERALPDRPPEDGDDLAGLVALETYYDPELSALGAVERRRLLIALGILTDADGWTRIRQRFGTSINEACAVWQDAIDRLLPPTPG